MAMNLVPGECVEPVLCDGAERPAPAQVRARFFDAVRVLAQLHRIVPAAAGLGDEPAVGLADEVDRWTRAFATLPREMAGDYERAAKALRASMPAPLPAGGQPRRLPAREHPVRGDADQRGHRLGDLVGGRPAHRPVLADLLHRRRRAPRGRAGDGRGHPGGAARSCGPTRTRSARPYPNSAGSTRSPVTRRPASPACCSSGRMKLGRPVKESMSADAAGTAPAGAGSHPHRERLTSARQAMKGATSVHPRVCVSGLCFPELSALDALEAIAASASPTRR